MKHEAGNPRGAINIHEGEKVDAGAFKTLARGCLTMR